MIDKSSIKLTPCADSKYIKIKQMDYMENGIQKSWEIADSLDSVSILIHNIDNESVILVRQFRPAVFLKNNDGYMIELCAGLVDKPNLSLEQIAREEVLEECGYEAKHLVKIAEFYSSVGTSGAKQSVFYTEVRNENKLANGGGIDDEFIEIIEVKINQLDSILKLPNITPGLGFSLMWFCNQKGIKCKN